MSAVIWKRSHDPNVAPAPRNVNAALPANATCAPTHAPSAAARCGASQPASTMPTRIA